MNPNTFSELKEAGFTRRSIEAWKKIDANTVNSDYKKTCEIVKGKLGTGAIFGFLGARGTGKTVMSVALAGSVLNAEKPRTVLYTTAHRLFMRFKDSYRRDSSVSETDVHNEFRNPSLLIIDEVGRRQENDWENRTLIDLVDARHGDMNDTILISNQEKAVFDESIGDSLGSRMNESGGCLLFNWPSYRQ